MLVETRILIMPAQRNVIKTSVNYDDFKLHSFLTKPKPRDAGICMNKVFIAWL